MKRIVVGADHRGFSLKTAVADMLRGLKHEVIDVGAMQFNRDDDYPEFAFAVAKVLVDNRADRGVLMCGSGVGACVAANKVRGVRAGLCHDTLSVKLGVEDDDMNVLCLGARIVGVEFAFDLVRAFVSARFTGQDRHKRRLDMIREMEETPPA
jgi:ribose 5-phosphate isomerase B